MKLSDIFFWTVHTATDSGGLVEAETPYLALIQVYPELAKVQLTNCKKSHAAAKYTVVQSSGLLAGSSTYFREVSGDEESRPELILGGQ
ncbi:MAG: hypothetical protein F4X61_03050 [Rhodothermaceae bacterium]|nr:hypothetical protein [Rhodothermaceae bacterium]MYC03591.1 hypothetical protein [Rhodothermaceae bacterium]MYE64276.1 hypothetical protein [Rhodothermaceae bacterium]